MKALFPALLLAALAPSCILVVSSDGVDTWEGAHWRSTPTRTEARTCPEFHAVSFHGSGRLEARVGEAQSVVVTAEEALMPFLRTDVKDGVLVVDRAPGAPSTRRGVQVTITTQNLDAAAVFGSGDVRVTGVQSAAFRATVAGSGDLSVAGTADEVVVELDGSGDATLSTLAARKGRVRLSGSGDVSVSASEELDVALTGSGDVRYRGSPRLTQVVHGSGDVTRH